MKIIKKLLLGATLLTPVALVTSGCSCSSGVKDINDYQATWEIERGSPLLGVTDDEVVFKLKINFDIKDLRSVYCVDSDGWNNLKDYVDAPDINQLVHVERDGSYTFRAKLTKNFDQGGYECAFKYQIWATQGSPDKDGNYLISRTFLSNYVQFHLVNPNQKIAQDSVEGVEYIFTVTNTKQDYAREEEIAKKLLAVDDTVTEDISTKNEVQKRAWMMDKVNANILASILIFESLHAAEQANSIYINNYYKYKFITNIDYCIENKEANANSRLFQLEAETVLINQDGNVINKFADNSLNFSGGCDQYYSMYMNSIGTGLTINNYDKTWVNNVVPSNWINRFTLELNGNFEGTRYLDTITEADGWTFFATNKTSNNPYIPDMIGRTYSLDNLITTFFPSVKV